MNHEQRSWSQGRSSSRQCAVALICVLLLWHPSGRALTWLVALTGGEGSEGRRSLSFLLRWWGTKGTFVGHHCFLIICCRVRITRQLGWDKRHVNLCLQCCGSVRSASLIIFKKSFGAYFCQTLGNWGMIIPQISYQSLQNIKTMSSISPFN